MAPPRPFAQGLRGVWTPGLVASTMCDVINGGLRMGLYPTVKHVLSTAMHGGVDDVSFRLKLLSGALTGALGSFVGVPAAAAAGIGVQTGSDGDKHR